MESRSRCKNFTEKEKLEFKEVAKDFIDVIENKKSDAITVEAKRRAWTALTFKFNAVSETGCRNEKQLHALYDNLKKKSRKSTGEDKSEIIKTGDGTFCLTPVDDKVVALSTPQFKGLENKSDSSTPYLNFDTETGKLCIDTEDESQDIVIEINKNTGTEVKEPAKEGKKHLPPPAVIQTPKRRKMNLTETNKLITNKKLSILEINYQQEVMKLEKMKTLLNLQCQQEVMKSDKTRSVLDLQYQEEIMKFEKTRALFDLQYQEQVMKFEKKRTLLDIQCQEEVMKFEKTRNLLDLEIQLKKVLLENAKKEFVSNL